MTGPEAPTAPYRRGYRDGWIAALDTFHGLLDRGREVAYTACFDHWIRELAEWAEGDVAQAVPPPDLPRRWR